MLMHHWVLILRVCLHLAAEGCQNWELFGTMLLCFDIVVFSVSQCDEVNVLIYFLYLQGMGSP